MAEATETRIKVQDIYPGDVIRWEQLGAEDWLCTVYRVLPEKDGRIALTIEAPGHRARTFIAPPDLLIVRVC